MVLPLALLRLPVPLQHVLADRAAAPRALGVLLKVHLVVLRLPPLPVELEAQFRELRTQGLNFFMGLNHRGS